MMMKLGKEKKKKKSKSSSKPSSSSSTSQAKAVLTKLKLKASSPTPTLAASSHTSGASSSSLSSSSAAKKSQVSSDSDKGKTSLVHGRPSSPVTKVSPTFQGWRSMFGGGGAAAKQRKQPAEIDAFSDHAVVEMTGGNQETMDEIDLSDRGQVRPGARALSSGSDTVPTVTGSSPFEFSSLASAETSLDSGLEQHQAGGPSSPSLWQRHHRHPQGEAQEPKLPWWRLLLLNVYWFSFSLVWFTLLVIIVPSQVKDLMGDDNKGRGMFVLFTIVGVVTFVCSIIMGYYNDRMAETRFGRRRPLIVVGCLLMVPFLFGTELTQTFPVYVGVVICLTIGSVITTVPYNALFADIVPHAQHGSASAIMGALGQTGNLLGASVGLFYVSLGPLTFVILGSVMVFCMFITVLFTEEKPLLRSTQVKSTPKANKEFTWALLKVYLHPRRIYETIIFPLIEPLVTSSDFRWVFFTRFVFQLGQYTVQEYLQFWLANCVVLPEGIESAETAVSICVLPMLLTAIISSLTGGILSDKLGGRRKILVYVSGGMMVCCSALFMFVDNFYFAASLSGFFGLGFGCFLSVDFAIVMDVLPSQVDYARDMAVWNTALIIPQMIATPIAGLILDSFQQIGDTGGIACLGYKIIFGLAALYFFLGTVFVSRIKGIK